MMQTSKRLQQNYRSQVSITTSNRWFDSCAKNDAPWVRKEMNGMGLPFNSKSGEEILLESCSVQVSKIKNEANCRYEKQLEQDIVRNFATVETANVQITLPEKETIFDEEKQKEQPQLRLV